MKGRHSGTKVFHLVPEQEVVDMYNDGHHCSDIALHYLVSDQLVAFRLRLAGIEPKAGPKRSPKWSKPEPYPNPTPVQIEHAETAHRLYQELRSTTKVAQAMGCSQTKALRLLRLHDRLHEEESRP
jgi:hypothetical protein